MPDALLNLLTGAGVAGVFCALFVLGWLFPKSVVDDLKAENAELKRQNEWERQRADTAVAAAQTTRDILAAWQAGAQSSRPPQPRTPDPPDTMR